MDTVQQGVTPIDNPLLLTPMVHPTTTNEDVVDPIVSGDEVSLD